MKLLQVYLSWFFFFHFYCYNGLFQLFAIYFDCLHLPIIFVATNQYALHLFLLEIKVGNRVKNLYALQLLLVEIKICNALKNHKEPIFILPSSDQKPFLSFLFFPDIFGFLIIILP